MNETERIQTESKPKHAPAVLISYNCGCGARFTSEAIGNTPESLAAWRHAETTGHSMTIHGEIRVEREFPRVRSAYQPSQGVA